MRQEEYQRHEEFAFDYLLKKYRWQIMTTPHYALIDGVAVMGNEITHIIEFKSRNESLNSLNQFGTYLISYEKIRRGIDMAKMMRVPFILIVYLIKDQKIIGVEIGDDYGISIPMEIRETRTQKNSHSPESVIRRNAFIDLENFTIL